MENLPSQEDFNEYIKIHSLKPSKPLNESAKPFIPKQVKF
jgi:hypothetical protein